MLVVALDRPLRKRSAPGAASTPTVVRRATESVAKAGWPRRCPTFAVSVAYHDDHQEWIALGSENWKAQYGSAYGAGNTPITKVMPGQARR